MLRIVGVMPEQVPIAEGLWRMTDDGPRLIGGRSRSSGVVTFPYQPTCPKTAAQDMEEILLEPEGTLWTFTIQGFLPKKPPYAGPETPETFRPYGVGYVELPGQVKVEARLTEGDPDKLRIGMKMRLVVVPFRTDDEGRDVMMFAFEPVGG